MFARRLLVQAISVDGAATSCPLRWIDNFAMRNFTNDAIFDDTLPIADGLMEAGYRVPIAELERSMQDWFRRKSYLNPGERLQITPETSAHDGG